MRRHGARHRPLPTRSSPRCRDFKSPFPLSWLVVHAVVAGRQGGEEKAWNWGVPIFNPPPSKTSEFTVHPPVPNTTSPRRRRREGGRPRPCCLCLVLSALPSLAWFFWFFFCPPEKHALPCQPLRLPSTEYHPPRPPPVLPTKPRPRA
ncbi:hypothetical protein LX32DRAFT_332702 [Colletotrichum zoysiae]|uniref:Uncharacterized protein n=1 Tax=Colletotrichum zoysiae TaxID=1216348 RepID=A0AAD9M261_9PEZI|nr:hypothetical protein LX32DRAFT_332702 [Colletotrichum zoysiae]